jgi:hypothetical protein
MEKTVKGKIEKIEEEGRFLNVSSDDGKSLALRISNGTDIEGVPDRSYFKIGMRFTAIYEEQKERNEDASVPSPVDARAIACPFSLLRRIDARPRKSSASPTPRSAAIPRSLPT